MENELKQRGVSYEELALLDEAFTQYTDGVTFRDEDAKAEALLEYERGFIEYPEEAGDVEDYIAERVPYFAPGIVEAGEGIPTLKRAYNLATKALKELEGVYATTEEAAEAAGLRNLGERLKPISAANLCIELVRENIYGRLKKEGGDV